MIHLHKQLWAVIALHRDVSDSEYKLAYMTHREYKKDGSEDDKFTNRKSTGNSWAKGYSREPKIKHLEFDNTPTSGFGIVGSKSRWSTQNKVIQVEDPRGFVVEIPVSALTTLLKHTTVINGIVQEECIWGREGNNHILIPVNSDIYIQAKQDTFEHNNKVKISSLDVGDKVKFSVDGCEYIYAGKYKAHWKIQLLVSTEKKKLQSRHQYKYSYVRSVNDSCIREEVVTESGYKHLFVPVEKAKYTYNEFKSSGACIVMSSGNDIPEYNHDGIYAPDKIKQHFGDAYAYDYSNLMEQYTKITLHSLEKKEKP